MIAVMHVAVPQGLLESWWIVGGQVVLNRCLTIDSPKSTSVFQPRTKGHLRGASPPQYSDKILSGDFCKEVQKFACQFFDMCGN